MSGIDPKSAMALGKENMLKTLPAIPFQELCWAVSS